MNDSEYQKKYRREHPERAHKWDRQRHENLRNKVFDYLGGAKCIRCGCDKKEALELNHKNLGGSKENRMCGWRAIYRSILKNKRKDEFEILCRVCNSAHYLESKYDLKYIIKASW